jgi:DNA topoisomerase IB
MGRSPSSTSGKRRQREQAVVDPGVFSVVRSLKLRRSGADYDELLVYRSGKRWHNLTAGDINDYLRELSGDDFTAKDFRTWHATVPALADLGKDQEFGDAATHGRAERAVLGLLR